MPKKIKRLNIVDLESTCWPDQIAPDGQHQRLVSEIIEIGIVQIDVHTLKVIGKKSYLIKPVDNPKLSKYCTELTSITDELLDKEGTTFDYAVARMMSEFKTAKYEWASWGDYDRSQFQRECDRENVQYPFHKTHLNLKYLLSMLIGGKIQRNVDGMLDFFHMTFDGNPHRGVDDAYNLAMMYIKVMKNIRERTNCFIKQGIWGDEFHAENS